MAKALRNLSLDRVDLVGEPANAECRVTLFKARARIPSQQGVTKGVGMPETTDTIESLRKELDELKATAKAEADAKAEEVAKAKAEADAKTAEAEKIALAAKPMADQIEVLKAERAKDAEALAKAMDALAKAEGERKLAHFTDVAKADYEPLGAADELGPVLMEIADSVKPETAATLERILKAASAQLSSSELIRTRASRTAPAGDAMTAITKAAEALVASGAEPTLERAKARAVRENPSLLDAYASQTA